MPYLVAELENLLRQVQIESARLQALLPYAPDHVRIFDENLLNMQARVLANIQNPQAFRALTIDEDQMFLTAQVKFELYSIRKQWIDWAQGWLQTLRAAQEMIQLNQISQFQSHLFDSIQQSNQSWNELFESMRQSNWDVMQRWISTLG